MRQSSLWGPKNRPKQKPVFGTPILHQGRPKVSQNGKWASNLEPKIVQNPEKSCSRGLPESSLKKVTKNDAIWVPSRPQKSRFRTVGVAKIKK